MSGRIRSIKPEWLEDELMCTASSDARVLSIAMILMADDYGNGRCHVATMASTVFPPSGMSPEDLLSSYRKLQESLLKLSEIRFCGVYQANGQTYFTIRNWSKHQKVNHPGKPLVPSPPEDFWRVSREPLETLLPDLRPTTNDQRPGPTTPEKKRTRKPRFEESNPTLGLDLGQGPGVPLDEKPPEPSAPEENHASELKAFYCEQFKASRGVAPEFGKRWSRAVAALRELGEAHGVPGAKQIIKNALGDEYARRINPWELVEDANKWAGTRPKNGPAKRGPPQPNASTVGAKPAWTPTAYKGIET